MTSGHGFLNQPRTMEIRVVERDGKRVLQQYRNKPGGYAYEYAWVDVMELPRLATVTRLTPKP
jgi:hypothetical protein